MKPIKRWVLGMLLFSSVSGYAAELVDLEGAGVMQLVQEQAQRFLAMIAAPDQFLIGQRVDMFCLSNCSLTSDNRLIAQSSQEIANFIVEKRLNEHLNDPKLCDPCVMWFPEELNRCIVGFLLKTWQGQTIAFFGLTWNEEDKLETIVGFKDPKKEEMEHFLKANDVQGECLQIQLYA